MYNKNVKKYWVEEKTSAQMELAQRLEVREKVGVEAEAETDNDGNVIMGKQPDFNFTFDGMDDAPSGSAASGSNDPTPVPKTGSCGLYVFVSNMTVQQ